MANYTNAQFDKEYKKFLAEGGYMSEADLNLARRDPDAGMSLISYKRDYANAKDDAGRAAANMGAENIRTTYGGYTAGSQGSAYYYKSNPTPSSFVSPEKPTYANSYKDKHEELLGAVMDFGDFEYDYEKDPSYQAYAKAYTREGDRATKNALTEAAARTGGVASSYGATAAAQAGNYYASQMADKVPQLYDAAYNRYLNQFQMAQGKLSAVQAAQQMERAMYEADLNQYNIDNQFGYNKHTDQIAYMNQQRENELSAALTGAELGDYSRLKALGYDTTKAEKLFDAGVSGAELENAINESVLTGNNLANTGTEFANALNRYNATGDISGLSALGITNTEQLAKAWETSLFNSIEAEALELEKLGYAVDDAKLANAADRAAMGDFSELARVLGTDVANTLKAEWNSVKSYESKLREQEITMGNQNITSKSLGIDDAVWNHAMELANAGVYTGKGSIGDPALGLSLPEKQAIIYQMSQARENATKTDQLNLQILERELENAKKDDDYADAMSAYEIEGDLTKLAKYYGVSEEKLESYLNKPDNSSVTPKQWLETINTLAAYRYYYGEDLDLANTALGGETPADNKAIEDAWAVVKAMSPEQLKKMFESDEEE